MGQPLTRARVRWLEEYGEEAMFERILSGETVRTIMFQNSKEAPNGCLSWSSWYDWLDSVEGRRERYNEVLRNAAHVYAARAVDTAQAATAENVQVARLQVDTDKWIASKLNDKYDTRQKDVNVNISINDLHAQAAALMSEALEREIVDAEYSVVEDGDGGGSEEA